MDNNANSQAEHWYYKSTDSSDWEQVDDYGDTDCCYDTMNAEKFISIAINWQWRNDSVILSDNEFVITNSGKVVHYKKIRVQQ